MLVTTMFSSLVYCEKLRYASRHLQASHSLPIRRYLSVGFRRYSLVPTVPFFSKGALTTSSLHRVAFVYIPGSSSAGLSSLVQSISTKVTTVPTKIRSVEREAWQSFERRCHSWPLHVDGSFLGNKPSTSTYYPSNTH